MIFSDEQSFDTAQELVDFFEKNNSFRVNSIWDTHTIGRGGHIYRGQSDAKWDLMPKVFRSYYSLNDYTLQVPGKYDKKQNLKWLGFHLHAELRSVFIFLETADKVGIETPINYTRLNDHYHMLYSAFNKNEYDHNTDFPNQASLEEFALAQHHGVPTRLIDWTESPLIACFFAAYGASSVAPKEHKICSKKIAVFCFQTIYFSRSDQVIRVNAPRHRNNFMRMQKGVFMHMPRANSYFLNNEKWPSLEKMIVATTKLQGSLKKYCIPASEADNLLKLLYNYDITKSNLMPTLDNIAESFSYSKKLF